MFLLSAHRTELEVHCDDDEGSHLESTRRRLSRFTLKLSTEIIVPYGLLPPWSGFSEIAVSA